MFTDMIKQLDTFNGNITFIDKVPQHLSDTNYLIGIDPEQSPNTEIYLQSVLPVSKTLNIDSIQELNTKISQLATKYNAKYIDLWPVFNKNAYIRDEYVLEDGIHLSPAGNITWSKELKKYL